MSYTILTIPFNLKEKEEGDFLKKGFVIADIIPEFFEGMETANSFLHVATFNNSIIKKTAINLFVEKNFPDSKLSKQINEPIFVTSNFYDSKHLRSVKNYIHLTNFQLLNKKKVTQQEDENEIKLPYNLINSNFLYKKNIIDNINTHESEFEIDGEKWKTVEHYFQA